MKPRLILDISRTIGRATHPVPTGIDRVELAYAEYLLAHEADRLDMVAVHITGHWGIIRQDIARRMIAHVAARWRAAGTGAGAPPKPWADLAACIASSLARSPTLRPWRSRPKARSLYLLMSHHHLSRPRVIADILQRENAALVCLVHDLIPMEFPEYARAGQPEIHANRMNTVVRMADAIVVNSEATRQSLLPHLAAIWRNPPVLVAHLGVEPEQDDATAITAEAAPYFVCVGTIEPRKNHLLLMHLWRRMATDGTTSPPRLVLVGRRGWENENVVDMLERCAALKGLVQERNDMSDHDVHVLLRGARALLLPSFAEGYGLPVAEALALGVPVICSDLPALREVGRDAAEYLDPLDGPSWDRAIADYTAPDSPRRAAQMVRIQSWRAPGWDDHMRDVLRLIDGIAV